MLLKKFEAEKKMHDATQPSRSSQPTQPNVRVPLPEEAIQPPHVRPRGIQAQVQPQPERRRRKRWRLFNRYTPRAVIAGVLMGLAVFGLLALLISVGAYGYFQLYELIVPGVYVGDVPLGGKTTAQATQELNRVWNVDRGLIVTDGERTWYASPADFGLSLDAAATAQRALNVAHGQDTIAEMSQMLDTTLNGYAIAPVVSLDEEAARAGLEAFSTTINLPAQDASLRIEGQEVIALPGQPGYSLDVDATLAVLSADPGAALADGYLPLVLVPIAPRITDASAAVAEAERLLAQPLDISAYDPITDEHLQLSASPEVIATWLGVEPTEDGPKLVVDEGRLAAYLDEINQTLGEGRYVDSAESASILLGALQNATPAALLVSHTPTTYTVQSGDTLTSISWKVGMPYWRIVDENPGLDPDATLNPGQVLTIPSKDDLLPLPVVIGKRIVVSIGEQRLWGYEDGEQVFEYVISTGIDRSPTQPGVFQVQTHDPNAYASLWDLTMPNFLGIYEAWPGFMNGFHGLPTLSSGQILWANILGSPASYGCIILDLDDAEALYTWAEEGVVVEIVE
jgi:LysM repeat protein